jgi:hypothetical protein
MQQITAAAAAAEAASAAAAAAAAPDEECSRGQHRAEQQTPFVFVLSIESYTQLFVLCFHHQQKVILS